MIRLDDDDLGALTTWPRPTTLHAVELTVIDCYIRSTSFHVKDIASPRLNPV